MLIILIYTFENYFKIYSYFYTYMGVPMPALAIQSLPFTVCFWVGNSGLLS